MSSINNRLTFSGLRRNDNIALATKNKYDLLVIGGGVTGAGIALDASSRGLNVLLLEKQDFAAGTSSRSTKLIHGGLRYLKQLEFDLVREVGFEREVVYKNARHIVRPEKMLLPIIKNGSLSELGASLGICIYDWLAGVKASERRKMLNKNEVMELEPLLNQEILKAAALYTEYRTDDARLVIEILKKAVEYGANCLNYLSVESFTYDSEGKVSGVNAKDLINNKDFKFESIEIVNSAGPWVDKLREKDKSLKGKKLFHSKGVHIVVHKSKLAIKQATYFDIAHDKGRMAFAIPKGEIVYIGTTDTPYEGQLEEPRILQKDVDYLLKAVNQMFPEAKLTSIDVISSWAGLRPLIFEEGKSPSEMSRKDEVFVSKTGLISIGGGKLTGYRKMAEKVVDMALRKFHNSGKKEFEKCKTEQIVLAGGSFKDSVDEYIDQLAAQFDDPSAVEIKDLFFKYGENTKKILEITRLNSQNTKTSLLVAELRYCVTNEMVIKPTDFFIRRTGDLYFSPDKIHKYKKTVLQEMQELFSMHEEQINKLSHELEHQCKSIRDFQ